MWLYTTHALRHGDCHLLVSPVGKMEVMMALSDQELREKLIRENPGCDVIYEGRPGGETLMVMPAGYLKKQREESRALYDRLKEQFKAMGMDLDAFLRNSHYSDDDDSFTIVIESEPPTPETR